MNKEQSRYEIFLGETVVGWTHFEYGDPPMGVVFGRLHPLVDLSSWQLPTESEKVPLAARTAEEWAKMPTYYIMDLADGMAETVAKVMPSPEQIAANTWLTDSELAVYTTEFGRTGFQGGLNSYRMGATGIGAAESQLYAGKSKI